LTGNTFWLEKKDWRDFAEYEKEVNNVIGKYRMMAVCSYSLDKCGASEVIDVVSNHQFALVRREGKWELIESPERMQAEQALKESEENYRQLTESISDVFFEMDKDLRYTYWNSSSEKFTGISAKDAIGKSLSELFPGTLNTRKAESVYLDVLRTQQPQTFINEYQFGGKDFFFDISAYPSKRGLSVFVKDITERTQAEEELREKEEFNFALFQHNPIQTIVMDRGGRVLKVNMAKRKSGDRLPNIGDVMYKDYAAKHEIDMHAELMECIRSSKTKSFSELKYGDKFLDITIASFPDGAIITSQDITERKLTEEALRIRDKAIASSLNAIAIADLDGNLTYVNSSFLDLWGYKDEREVLGRPSVSFWESEKKARDVARTSLTRGSGTSELVAKRKDGSTFIAQLSANLVLDEYGKPICKMASIMDITARKRAEEEIKNSQSQLRNLTAHLQSVREEERTLIAREMHDELGQALTAMKMDLSWLDKRLPKDQRSLLEKTKSMSKLADATLQTVKKISAELRPGLLDDLGLPAAIEWQAEEFQTRTGIKCEITVDPEDIILDKDRSTAIFRIFQETLTNVARHAKATKVKVSLKEKAGKIELKVRDNGKGITEKQVSDPKSFGLIGIKERAYYLGGKVVIKGLQDKGTTLTIRIPLPKKGKTK
jgi:PAS domain S-box-containing protein